MTSSSGAIGRITPSGAITEFPLPTANIGAGDLTVGPDGNLWFPEELSVGPSPRYAIGRITPSGALTEFPLPTASIDLGSYPVALTVGPDGNLWFPGSDAIGRITPAGSITEFPLPTVGFNPGGLTVGPDGNLWFPGESPREQLH